MRLKVKICGITRPIDAKVAAEAGAAYVGAVLVPGSRRRVSTSRASTLATAVDVPLVVVTSDLSVDEAAEAAEKSRAGVLQLHGDESPTVMKELRSRGPWELWKAVQIRTEEDARRAVDLYGAVVDLLLLDGWSQDQLGGTGRRFPWEVVQAVRDEVPDRMRIGVAGGLSPENVADAVSHMHPDLVDVSTGVEEGPGSKDHERVRSFVRRAVEASARRNGSSVGGAP